MRKLFCFAIIMLSLAVSAAALPIGALVLCDFDKPSDVERFDVRESTPPSSMVANADGTASIFFPKWQQDSVQWPAAILTNDKGLPKDFTDYDFAVCDVRNVGDKTCTVLMYIRDPEGASLTASEVIAPGETRAVQMAFEVAPAKLDLSQIWQIHIHGTRPPDDMSLVVDNLRLENGVPRWLEAIGASIETLRKEARQYPEEMTHIMASLDAQYGVLMNEASKAKSASDLAEIRPDVIALRDRVRRDAARAVTEAKLRRSARKSDPNAALACGWASSMEKIFPKDVGFTCSADNEATVELAGNETESIQLLIYAFDRELKGANVSVGALMKNGKPGPTVEASPVGFVETQRPPYPVKYVGWHPDPILDFLKGYNIKEGEVQPVWIRITAPAGTPAGEYKAQVTVKAADVNPVKLTLKVRVWDFDVPQERHLRTAMSLYDVYLPYAYGKLTEPMRQKYEDFVLSYRINPDNIYRPEMPPIESLKRWDKKGLNAFNILYVQKPDGIKAGDPFPAEQRELLLRKVDESVALLRANGLFDKAYLYGFDEIGPESFSAMQDIFGEVKRRHPDLLTLTTGYDDTFGITSKVDAMDAWCPLTPKYDLKRVEDARARGKQIWWYTCISPKEPWANWLIEYDAIDARVLMGLQTAKYRPDGYLYYAMMRWPLTKKPITFGPYTDWPPASFWDNNGDGSIICAGPHGPLPTIRLENIRDGIEDYEYFWVLEQEIQRLKKLSGPAAAQALVKAEKAMDIGTDLVGSLSNFTKSPQSVRAKRSQVAEAIVNARKVRK